MTDDNPDFSFLRYLDQRGDELRISASFDGANLRLCYDREVDGFVDFRFFIVPIADILKLIEGYEAEE